MGCNLLYCKCSSFIYIYQNQPFRSLITDWEDKDCHLYWWKWKKEERYMLSIEQPGLKESLINSGVRQPVIIVYCQPYTTYDSSWSCLALTSCWVFKIYGFKPIRGDILHCQAHECCWQLLCLIFCKIMRYLETKSVIPPQKFHRNIIPP